jgi:hypothetical protein
MRETGLTFCLILLPLLNLFSQDTINEKYFIELRKKLYQDREIKEVKYIQIKDSKSRISLQAMFVKLKNDSTNRYWRVGKRFEFIEGRLSWIDDVDLITKASIDTAKYFDCDGIITHMYIYDNCYTKIYPLKEFSGVRWMFKKYYCYKPEAFKEIRYEGGRIIEKNIKYIVNLGFVLHGDMIYYNKDGVIEKTVKYFEGKEMK